MAARDTALVDDFVSGAHTDFKGMPMGGSIPQFSHFSMPDMYGNKPMNAGMSQEMEMTEATLARLREVIGEAKRLCIRLRSTGHQAEAHAAASELLNIVNTPLPWEQPLDNAYPGLWGETAGSEEAAVAAGASFDCSPELNGMHRQVAEDLQKGGKWGGSMNANKDTKPGNRKGKKNAAAPGSNLDGGNAGLGNGGNGVWRQSARGGRDSAWSATGSADQIGPEGSTFAFVEFKRGRVRKYASVPDIPPGKYVMVDGDRGQDCGLLVQTIRKVPGRDDEIVCMEGTNIDDKLKLEDGRVIRLATEEEVKRLHSVIAAAEILALKTCRERCKELNIEIGLVDVEYQYDMKKISFFFDCDHSVDFRSLVRELYRSFGARIWMENINPKVRNSMPDAANNSTGNNNSNNNNNSENSNWSGNRRRN